METRTEEKNEKKEGKRKKRRLPEIPSISDKQKIIFLKLLKRAVKKAKGFTQSKLTRRIKQAGEQGGKLEGETILNEEDDEEKKAGKGGGGGGGGGGKNKTNKKKDDPEKLSQDLNHIKAVSPEKVAMYAWSLYFDKKPPEIMEEGRQRELISSLIRSPAVKSAHAEIEKERRRRGRRIDKIKKKAESKKKQKQENRQLRQGLLNNKNNKGGEDDDDDDESGGDEGDEGEDVDKEGEQKEKQDDNNNESEEEEEEDDEDENINNKKSSKPTTEKEKKKEKDTTYQGMRVGNVVDGIVDGVEPFGLFIVFWMKKKQQKGLCHLSQVSTSFMTMEKLKTEYHIGDPVRAVIIKIDPKQGKVGLSMRSNAFPEGIDPTPALELPKRLTKENNKSNKGPTKDGKTQSIFVSSLNSSSSSSSSSAAPVEETDHVGGDSERKKDMIQLMELLHGIPAKSSSGNRLGQRDRKRLFERVYGSQAEHVIKRMQERRKKKKEEKLTSSQGVEETEKGGKQADRTLKKGGGRGGGGKQAERTLKKGGGGGEQAERTSKKGGGGGVEQAARTLKKGGGEQAERTSEGEDKLHPSWAAKKKHEGAMTAFQGKKITF